MLSLRAPPGKRFPILVAVLLALLIGAIQIAGRAYRCDFDGHPDEAAHFVTGLMVHDYLVKGLGESPIQFAGQYYLHYPKVAFGHWPPLFYVLEAGLWLVVPPSRASAMLLVAAAGWAAAILFYFLACKFTDRFTAAFLSVVMVVTPVFQESVEECMTETLTLLLGVLFVGALIRAVEDGFSRWSLTLMGIWCVLGLLAKGTGAILLLAPGLAMLVARPELWRRSVIWIGGLGVATIGGFAILSGGLQNAAAWAGVTSALPWRIDIVPLLAGWGVVAAAAGGMVLGVRHRVKAVMAVSVAVASILISSFFLRSMAAKRHWIILMPCLLLLAGYFIRELGARLNRRAGVLAAVAVAAAIIVTLPRDLSRQGILNHEAVLANLPLPGRVVISSASDWREGGWIAAQCLRESRPTSYLLRGTKLLASMFWNGSGYRLRMSTGKEILAALDRFAIEGVITDDRLDGDAPLPHHMLLKAALASSPEWRQCAQGPQVEAWCRTGPTPAATERIQVSTNSGLATIVEAP